MAKPDPESRVFVMVLSWQKNSLNINTQDHRTNKHKQADKWGVRVITDFQFLNIL
jgi:hypothetical protein